MGELDPRLQAAIVAAINAYMDEQEALAAPAKPAPGDRWRRQGRSDALKAAQACFRRPSRWR
jgi:hypothetical protein